MAIKPTWCARSDTDCRIRPDTARLAFLRYRLDFFEILAFRTGEVIEIALEHAT